MKYVDFAKLLSSDWFFNHWHLLNLQRTHSEKLRIQTSCRSCLEETTSLDGELNTDFLPMIVTSDGIKERHHVEHEIVSLSEFLTEDTNSSFLYQICFGATLRRAQIFCNELPDVILEKVDSA